MKQRIGPALVLVLLLLPVVGAQEPGFNDPTVNPPYLQFSVATPDGVYIEVDPASRFAEVRVQVTDSSLDAGQPHRFVVVAEPQTNDTTWQAIVQPPEMQMMSGETREFSIQFATSGTGDAYFPVAINVTGSPIYTPGSKSQTVNLVAHMEGARALAAKVVGGGSVQAGPDEAVTFELELQNLALERKGVSFRVASNPCNMPVQAASVFLPPRETVSVIVGTYTPAEKIWYGSEACPIVLQAEFTDGSASKSIPLSIQVQGGYFDPQWAINVFWIAAPIALLVLFILWRKRRIEEEILGKPQKPWTIPAEQIYLAELQQKDPRAAYVVRNFLMEDEYRSSLDWYHAYKAATKGERAKERHIVKEEHKLERWEKKQARILARPEKKADKYALKLQKKLDRKDRKAYRKQMRKWRKSCKKMDAKNQKVHEKLHGVWEKQKKRAEKKGIEVPPEPVLAEPDYPDEPFQNETPLAEHKWAAKAIRFQDRMTRKEARLQASYDKGHAKRTAKARKKAQKIARKLDDPDFANEHALLQGADAE